MEGFGIHGVCHLFQAGTLLLAGNIPGTLVPWICTADPVSGHPCNDVLLPCLGGARGQPLYSLQEPGPLQMSGVCCDCVTYGQASRHLNLLLWLRYIWPKLPAFELAISLISVACNLLHHSNHRKQYVPHFLHSVGLPCSCRDLSLELETNLSITKLKLMLSSPASWFRGERGKHPTNIQQRKRFISPLCHQMPPQEPLCWITCQRVRNRGN